MRIGVHIAAHFLSVRVMLSIAHRQHCLYILSHVFLSAHNNMDSLKTNDVSEFLHLITF